MPLANNQGNIIKTIETVTSLSGLNYNQAILALANFRSLDINKGVNAALILILQNTIPSAKTNINGLLAEYAAVHFNGDINAINDLTL